MEIKPNHDHTLIWKREDVVISPAQAQLNSVMEKLETLQKEAEILKSIVESEK